MTKVIRNLETSIAEFDRLLSDKDHKEIRQQFNLLKEFSLNLLKENKVNVEVAKQSANAKKNRYADILPFDETRVVLKDDGSGDYINASWIKGIDDKKRYIAAQGPIKHTVRHFWRMLWETNTSTIIMACNFEENGKQKCERYWNIGTAVLYPDKIGVNVVEEGPIHPSFSYRRFRLSKDNEEKFIHHYHYNAWPDYGAPKNVEDFIEMLKRVRQHKGILTIHCSAGCGRTGAICALDYCWSLIKDEKVQPVTNLYMIVENLRKQRQSMVQAVEQLIFLYTAVRELFKRNLEILKKNKHLNASKPIYENDGGICQISVPQKITCSKPGNTKVIYRQKPETEPEPLYANLIDGGPNKDTSVEDENPYIFGEQGQEQTGNIRRNMTYEHVTCVKPSEDGLVSKITPKKPNVKINDKVDVFNEKDNPTNSTEHFKTHKTADLLRRNKNPSITSDKSVDQVDSTEAVEIQVNGKRLDFPNKIERVTGPRDKPENFKNVETYD